MAKVFPIHPAHPERNCWGCDKYCPSDSMACGNGSERTQHPMELFGEDWAQTGLDPYRPLSVHTQVMAIPHALPGQAIDVQALGAGLANHKTTALFKSADLEVMRLVLLAGKALPAHAVAGEITVHCIEGCIDVTAGGESHILRAGQLLFLSGGMSHAVTALEDSSALVTIALRK